MRFQWMRIGACVLTVLAASCKLVPPQPEPDGSTATARAGPADRDRPNVLFIAVDDLNDWVGVLGGHPQAKSPCIDSLAKRGVLFTNAHCSAPACAPSRASLLTGMQPSTTGVYFNSSHWRASTVLADAQTLPMHFRNQGYRTLGAGKLFHAHTFNQKAFKGHSQPEAWEDYFPALDRQLPDEALPEGRPVNTNWNMYGGSFDWSPLDIEDDEMGDGQVVSWAERILGAEPVDDRPLFLGVGIYRPHVPWYVPTADFEAFALDEVVLPEWIANDLEDVPVAGQKMTSQLWHAWMLLNEKWKPAVQAYLASIRFADRMVGRLIKALDEGPLADNTIIVLWSDHGYHLGEKEHWEKFALWENTTHVPLIIVDPRPQATAVGERCDEPVSLLDIYPTLVTLCDLAAPAQVLEGVDLTPQLTTPQLATGRAVITTEGPGNHSVRSARHRYIRYANGSQELYDHADDPHEWRNLAAENEYSALIADLARWLPVEDAQPVPRLKE